MFQKTDSYLSSNFHRSPDDDLDFGGIFDTDSINLQTSEEAGGSMDPDIYSPNFKHKKAVNNSYNARVRMVPNVHDKAMTKYDKYMYYLKDPQGNNFYVDCPSSFGQRNNIITTAFFYLKDCEDVMLRALSKTFSRKQYWFSLLQIMKDIQDEELQNKIKIFRYPVTINKLVKTLDKGDASMGKAPVKVVDLFKGRDLFLKVNEKEFKDEKTNQTKKMTSYEDSEFEGVNSAISLDGGLTRVPFTGNDVQDKETMRTIFKYLKDNSPNMEKVKAKSWDDEMEQRVMDTIRATINDDKIYNIIMQKAQFKGGSGSKNYGSNKAAPQHNNIPPDTNASSLNSTENIASQMADKKNDLAANIAKKEEPKQEATSQPQAQAQQPAPQPQAQESAPAQQPADDLGAEIDFDNL